MSLSNDNCNSKFKNFYKKKPDKKSGFLGSVGFEPTKARPTDLQSVLFDHSRNSP